MKHLTACSTIKGITQRQLYIQNVCKNTLTRDKGTHKYYRENNYKKILYSTSRLALLLNECILFQQRKHSANSEWFTDFKKAGINADQHNSTQPTSLLELDSPHLTEATNSPAQTPTPPPPTHTQLPTNLTGVPGLVHGIWWHHSLFLPGILNPAALPLHTATISMATSPPPASLLAS